MRRPAVRGVVAGMTTALATCPRCGMERHAAQVRMNE